MIVYTVQKGDSLWRTAQNYQISLDSLIAANPQISDPNYILIGQQINIPELWMPPIPPEPCLCEDPQNCPCEDKNLRPFIYVSKEGDTLESIGHRFMVPLSLLLYYNLKHSKQEPLAAGTRVIIPELEPYPPQGGMPHPNRPHRHNQRPGWK